MVQAAPLPKLAVAPASAVIRELAPVATPAPLVRSRGHVATRNGQHKGYRQ